MKCRRCEKEKSHALLDESGVCSTKGTCGVYFDEEGEVTHCLMWRLRRSGAGNTYAAYGIDEFGDFNTTTDPKRARLFGNEGKAQAYTASDNDPEAWMLEGFRHEVSL